jgi:hypothetical protein
VYEIPKKLMSTPLIDSKKKKLMQEIRTYRSFEDVILYLLSLLERERITADDETIHTAFYKLKKEHPELLKDLTFSERDVFPFSNEVQRSLFNLQHSGLMEAINPVYKVYRIPKRSKEAILSQLSRSFSENEKEELKQMSKRLEEFLSK